MVAEVSVQTSKGGKQPSRLRSYFSDLEYSEESDRDLGVYRQSSRVWEQESISTLFLEKSCVL